MSWRDLAKDQRSNGTGESQDLGYTTGTTNWRDLAKQQRNPERTKMNDNDYVSYNSIISRYNMGLTKAKNGDSNEASRLFGSVGTDADALIKSLKASGMTDNDDIIKSLQEISSSTSNNLKAVKYSKGVEPVLDSAMAAGTNYGTDNVTAAIKAIQAQEQSQRAITQAIRDNGGKMTGIEDYIDALNRAGMMGSNVEMMLDATANGITAPSYIGKMVQDENGNMVRDRNAEWKWANDMPEGFDIEKTKEDLQSSNPAVVRDALERIREGYAKQYSAGSKEREENEIAQYGVAGNTEEAYARRKELNSDLERYEEMINEINSYKSTYSSLADKKYNGVYKKTEDGRYLWSGYFDAKEVPAIVEDLNSENYSTRIMALEKINRAVTTNTENRISYVEDLLQRIVQNPESVTDREINTILEWLPESANKDNVFAGLKSDNYDDRKTAYDTVINAVKENAIQEHAKYEQLIEREEAADWEDRAKSFKDNGGTIDSSNVKTYQDIFREGSDIINPQTGKTMRQSDVEAADSFAFATKEQRDTYSYLLTHVSEKAAEKYKKDIQKDLNYQRYQVMFNKWAAEDKANPIAHTLAYGLGAVLKSPAGIADLYNSFFNPGAVDEYDRLHDFTNQTEIAAQVIPETLNWTGDAKMFGQDLDSWIYGTVYSSLQSASNMAIANVALPAQAVSSAVSVLMGVEMLSDTIKEAKQKGYSDKAAAMIAIVRGSIEAVTEKYSIESILSSAQLTKGLRGKELWRQIGKTVRNSAISEGSEEFASNVLNNVFDIITNAPDNKIALMEEKIRNGKPAWEAISEVVMEMTGEDISAILAGAVSGVTMTGPAIVGNVGSGKVSNAVDTLIHGNKAMGNMTDEQRRNAQAGLIADAREAGNNSLSAKLAESADAKGKQLTNRQLYALEKSNVEAIIRQQNETAAKAIQQRLQQEDANIRNSEEIANAIVAGDREYLENFKDNAAVNAVMDEIQEGTADWVKELAENRVSLDVTNRTVGEDMQGKNRRYGATVTMLENQYRTAEGTVEKNAAVRLIDNDNVSRNLVSVRFEDGQAFVKTSDAAGNESIYNSNDLEDSALTELIDGAKEFGSMAQDVYDAYVPGQGVKSYLQTAKVITGLGMRMESVSDKFIQNIAKERIAEGMNMRQLKQLLDAGIKRVTVAGAEISRGTGRVSWQGNSESRMNEMLRTLENSKNTDDHKLADYIRSNIALVEALAEATGIEMEWYESTKTDRFGFLTEASGMQKGNVIRLDINAGMEKPGEFAKSAIQLTLGHETTHWLQKASPKGYRSLTTFVLETIAAEDPKLFAKLLSDEYETGKNERASFNYADAIDEVVANTCAYMLKNSQSLKEYVSRDAETAKGIVGHAKKTLQNIRKAFTGVKVDAKRDASYAGAVLLFQKGYAEQLQRKWDNALRDGMKLGSETTRQTEKEYQNKSRIKKGGEIYEVSNKAIDAAYEKLTAEYKEGDSETLKAIQAVNGFKKIEASMKEDGFKNKSRGLTYGSMRETLAKKELDKLSYRLKEWFPLSAKFDNTVLNSDKKITAGTIEYDPTVAGNSFYTKAKNEYNRVYKTKEILQMRQLGIQAEMREAILNESISKAHTEEEKKFVVAIASKIKSIIEESYMLGIERVIHEDKYGPVVFAYRTYNVVKFKSDTSSVYDPYIIATTIKQRLDKADAYYFDEIKIVGFSSGLSEFHGLSTIASTNEVMISDLYKFVKKLNRKDGGIKYNEQEKEKYLFSYTETNDGEKYKSRNSSVDSEGNTLTDKQQEYFKNSKVRDEDGNLRIVYHGTEAEFTVFDRTKGRSNMDIQGSFFSPWDIDAGGYGEKVKAYYLNITNPAPEGIAYKALNRFKGQNGAGIKAREYLESLGYDGVNNGDEEYIAFYPEQIKLVENKKPSANPDIRFKSRNSAASAAADLEQQMQTLSEQQLRQEDRTAKILKGLEELRRSVPGEISVNAAERKANWLANALNISRMAEGKYAQTIDEYNAGRRQWKEDFKELAMNIAFMTDEEVNEAAQKLAEYAADHNFSTDEGQTMEAADFVSDVKATTFKLTEEQAKDLIVGLKEFRKMYKFMKIQIVDDVRQANVDSLYADLIGNDDDGWHGVGYSWIADKEATSAGDQLSAIAQAVASIEDSKQRRLTYEMENIPRAEFVKEMKDSIIAAATDPNIAKRARSVTDRLDAKISKAIESGNIEQIQDAVDELKNTYERKLFNIRNEIQSFEMMDVKAAIQQLDNAAKTLKQQQERISNLEQDEKDNRNTFLERGKELSAVKDAYETFKKAADKNTAKLERRVEVLENRVKNIKESQTKTVNERVERRMKTQMKYLNEQKANLREVVEGRYNERRLRDQKTELKNRIKKIQHTFEQKLTKPSPGANVPKELRSAVIEVLSAVNMDTFNAEGRNWKLSEQIYKITQNERLSEEEKKRRIAEIERKRDRNIEIDERLKTKIQTLQSEYKAIAQNDESFRVYNKVCDEALTKLLNEVKNTKIAEMSVKQLQTVYEVMKLLETTVRNANEMIDSKIKKEAHETGVLLAKETMDVKKRATKGIALLADDWLLKQMRPETFFKQLAGFKKDSVWHMLYEDLNAGQLKALDLKRQWTGMFADLIADQKQVKELSKLVDVGLKDKNGDTIMITKDMALSLWMHLRNEDNVRHLMYGGLTVPNIELYGKGSADAWGDVRSTATLNAKRSSIMKEIRELNDQKKTIREELDEKIRTEFLTDKEEQQMRNEAFEKIKKIDQQLEAIEKESVGDLEKLAADYAQRLRQNIWKLIEGDEYALKWIERATEYSDKAAPAAMNETTMKMYGIKLFNVQNYWGIVTDPDFLEQNFEVVSADASLAGVGWAKNRLKSQKPMLLEGMTNILSRQIERNSQYAGMLIPISNFNKVYNTNFSDEETSAALDSDPERNTVARVVRDTFHKNGVDILTNIMKDVNGGRETSRTKGAKVASWLRGRMAQSALVMSASTAFAQAASYPTAAAEVGRQALGKAIATVHKMNGDVVHGLTKAEREAIQQYTPILWNRLQNNGTELGSIVGDKDPLGNAMNKVPWLTGWIQAMDVATVGRLWYASMYSIDDKIAQAKKNIEGLQKQLDELQSKSTLGTQESVRLANTESMLEEAKRLAALETGSKAYYEEVAKTFNRVVERTQPNYTTLQRPELLRTKDQVTRTLAMFYTQRLQNFNIVFEAAGELARFSKDAKNWANNTTLEDVREAKRKLSSAVTSQLVSAATITVMKTVANFLLRSLRNYRDDEEDITAESVLKRMGMMMGETIASNVFMGDVVYDVLAAALFKEKFYEPEADALQQLWNVVTKVTNLVTFDKDKYKDIKDPKEKRKAIWKEFSSETLDLAKAACVAVGVPVQNAEKIGKAIYYWAADAINGTILESDVKRTASQNAAKLFQAYAAGDEKQIKKFTEVFVDKDGKPDPKKAKSELQKVIKEYLIDGIITEEDAEKYLQEWIGKDENETYWMIEKWLTDDEDYAKANAFVEAVISGENVDAEIERYMEHGSDESDLKSYITSNLKEEYLEASDSERAAMRENIITAYEKLGTDRDKAEAKLQEWQMEIDTGLKYTQLEKYFVEDKSLDYDTVVDYLMQYGGMDRKKAEDKAMEWKGEADTGIKSTNLENRFVSGDLDHDAAVNYLVTYKGEKQKKAEEKVQKWEMERDTEYKFDNIEKDFVNKEYGAADAVSYLVQYGGENRKAAETKVKKWQMEIDTGMKYDDLKDSYIDDKAVDHKTAVNYLVQYGGKTKNDAEKEVKKWDAARETGVYVNDLQEAFVDGTVKKADAVDYMITYQAKSKPEAEKMVQQWQMEIDTGYRYGDIKSLIMDGTITAAQGKNWYMKYGGVTEKDASGKIDQINYEKATGYEASAAEATKYYSTISELGINANVWHEAYAYFNTLHTIRNDKGRQIKSVPQQYYEYVSKLNLSADQKRRIFRVPGDYADKTVRRFRF